MRGKPAKSSLKYGNGHDAMLPKRRWYICISTINKRLQGFEEVSYPGVSCPGESLRSRARSLSVEARFRPSAVRMQYSLQFSKNRSLTVVKSFINTRLRKSMLKIQGVSNCGCEVRSIELLIRPMTIYTSSSEYSGRNYIEVNVTPQRPRAHPIRIATPRTPTRPPFFTNATLGRASQLL